MLSIKVGLIVIASLWEKDIFIISQQNKHYTMVLMANGPGPEWNPPGRNLSWLTANLIKTLYLFSIRIHADIASFPLSLSFNIWSYMFLLESECKALPF